MLNKRYDFIFFFDVQDGNPNGDPDAGNLPRIDAETGQGLVTDVCLKRKVRNYIQITKNYEHPYDIYVKEKAVLGRAHFDVYKKLGIDTGKSSTKEITDPKIIGAFSDIDLPEGVSFSDDDDKGLLTIEADADKKEIKKWLKDNKENKEADDIRKHIEEALKEAKPRKLPSEEVEKGKVKMCEDYYDIRTFGAVMTLTSAPNCGQVRGPIQMTFSRSIDPIVVFEHSITRMAVATEAEAEKQQGDNRTMGRKFTVPYGIYRCHGFVSANYAHQTGFSEEDLLLFWEALEKMFIDDSSAARGLMSSRKLIVFEHETPLGSKPAHELFERVKCKRVTEGPARSFEDYEITLDGDALDKEFKKTVQIK